MQRFIPVVALAGAACTGVYLHSPSEDWYDGDVELQTAFGDALANRAIEDPGRAGISTGSAFFDGEWDFGTCVMTMTALSQIALDHPETLDRYLPAIESCADWLVTPEATDFATARWGGQRGLDALDDPVATHAYLGYLGVALGLYRLVDPDNPHAQRHDELVAGLLGSMQLPIAYVQTYPGEIYPCDMSTMIAAVGIHEHATGADHSVILDDFTDRWLAASRDPESGILYQALRMGTGTPIDAPRGSGTALSAVMVSWADPQLAKELYRPLADQGFVRRAGVAGILEYPGGHEGHGDVDSGPLVFGVGVSATGFGIGAARAAEDAPTYEAMTQTAWMFGLPYPTGTGRSFATGGGLGNAIMLTMLTTPTGGYRACGEDDAVDDPGCLR